MKSNGLSNHLSAGIMIIYRRKNTHMYLIKTYTQKKCSAVIVQYASYTQIYRVSSYYVFVCLIVFITPSPCVQGKGVIVIYWHLSDLNTFFICYVCLITGHPPEKDKPII